MGEARARHPGSFDPGAELPRMLLPEGGGPWAEFSDTLAENQANRSCALRADQRL